MQLYVGTCHVVSAEITVVMAVSTLNLADCAGEIRYLAGEASFRVELFCCTTLHVRVLPGRH